MKPKWEQTSFPFQSLVTYSKLAREHKYERIKEGEREKEEETGSNKVTIDHIILFNLHQPVSTRED